MLVQSMRHTSREGAKYEKHTRDEGHSVLATILGGLEDVRLNTGKGCANSLAGGVEFEAGEINGRTSGGNRATERRSCGSAAEQSL